ncbi:type IV pilus biogenesis/stability protein PilW [Vibrio sp. FNV 38]|nr:type IV pilus biogenesis/stability protein PilW [Vibrio sp. FNV 38]
MFGIKNVGNIIGLMIILSGCVTVTDNPKADIKSDPIEKSESRIVLGLGYLEQSNMLKARENFERALKHSPNYYRAQISMAHYLEKVGETAKAENLYRTSVRQHPKNGNVLNNYGTFLCKQGEYTKADEYFNRAIKQPYYYLVSASYENAALCSLKARKNRKAMNYFQRALDHEPNRPRALLQLARLEIDFGNYVEARFRLTHFHQFYGLQVPSLELLVELEDQVGNVAEKENYQKQLLQLRG